MIVTWFYRDSSVIPPFLEILFNKKFEDTYFVYIKNSDSTVTVAWLYRDSSMISPLLEILFNKKIKEINYIYI